MKPWERKQRDRLAESGVGRWITVPIPTLSFFEFVSIRNELPGDIAPDLRVSDLFAFNPGDFAALADKTRPLQPLFQRYLLGRRFSGNCHSGGYCTLPAL